MFNNELFLVIKITFEHTMDDGTRIITTTDGTITCMVKESRRLLKD